MCHRSDRVEASFEADFAVLGSLPVSLDTALDGGQLARCFGRKYTRYFMLERHIMGVKLSIGETIAEA